MTATLNTILISIASLAIGGASTWLVRAIFLTRPKLAISYQAQGGSSTGGYGNQLTIKWDYQVTITNLSKHDALNISVINSNNPQIQTLPVPHIKGLDKVELTHCLTKNLDRQAVVQAQHDFHGRLEPLELKTLALLIRYKNESGVPFFTDYARQNGKNSNNFRFIFGPKS